MLNSNIRPIIGLSGRARAGKDTVADYLEHKYGVKKFNFAGELKKKVMTDFRLTEEQVYGNEKEKVIPKYKRSPRQILQLVGTEWYRTIDPNYWIDSLEKEITSQPYFKFSKGITISDVRFPNEVEFIKMNGGISININRPFGDIIESSSHISENALKDWKFDFYIENDKDVIHLYQLIDSIMAEVIE